MMKVVAGLPFAIPKIDLSEVDILPNIDDVIMGEKVANKGMLSASFAGFKPPTIAISAFISASVARQAALSGTVAIPPLAFCSNCNM
ncbi:MAG: hypothetical protein GQ535_06190 [Rhodobacteraceae bacterium]|nr:hypothetical protein [Paracoccaceae bacterium]